MREQKGSMREHEGAEREHRGAKSEHKGAKSEQSHETGLSARAKRRALSQRWVTCCTRFGDIIYIYINVLLN